MSNEDCVYLIATKQNNKKYYLYEIDTDKQKAVWTTVPRDGLLFHNEQGAQSFIQKYMSRDKSKVTVFVIGVEDSHVK